MIIKTIQVAGIEPALEAMRNPMDSWEKSDSTFRHDYWRFDVNEPVYHIGKVDKELSEKLQNAGPEHCKHLRMIMVWATISAPRYWWTEFDTYRIGVEKESCSTMHKLMSRPLKLSDFEHDEEYAPALEGIINSINGRMENYKELKNEGCDLEAKEVWREIIQLLPQSYLQRRTVMMSYAALRNIVRQRAGHKLYEWAWFIAWAKDLPESWMIFD